MMMPPQHIFKALSTRSRIKPHELFTSIDEQISSIQSEVDSFNKTQHSIHILPPRFLKSMTLPKHQHHLKFITLPQQQKKLTAIQVPPQIECPQTQATSNVRIAFAKSAIRNKIQKKKLLLEREWRKLQVFREEYQLPQQGCSYKTGNIRLGSAISRVNDRRPQTGNTMSIRSNY